ncbi:phosphatidate phosphatase App1 family protein [Aliikangiella coralliicola]|uniref:DUF2183 domain-containing protein n=1 Tax=Aliikangiella coralliicola TaxID=2592383 RepID=A0A545UJK7_9GAMM|nr:App1 family protein [Aliikangiella coralliicola]TQV89640.1 DUF2183 domain-containing protein [Aliikangiella coralliicola]
MIRLFLISLILIFAWVPLKCLAEEDSTASEQAEKRVTFYTTYGYQSNERWKIPVRLWVSEDLDFFRKLTLKTARKIIQHKAKLEDLTEQQKRLFKSRARDFLRDSESGEVIKIQFDNDPDKQVFVIESITNEPETDFNGTITGLLELPYKKANQLSKAQNSQNGWLSFHAVSSDHFGVGRVRLVEPEGVSVISDIDDTVKVTQIPLGNPVVLHNTFFKPFKAAKGMANKYRSFDETTAFHYVSGAPWQLYGPIEDFLFSDKEGFPHGSFHMKNVRTNLFESETYQDIGKLIAGGATQRQKLEQISQIIAHFPQRKFILIGDSGEHDPEIFAEIKQLYPKQVKEIRIRDVVNDQRCNSKRLQGMVVIPTEEKSNSCSQMLK